MKNYYISTRAYLILFMFFINTILVNGQSSPLNVSLPSNNTVWDESGGGTVLAKRVFHIATISTPNPFINPSTGLMNFYRVFVNASFYDQPFLFEEIEYRYKTAFTPGTILDWPILVKELDYYIADIHPRDEGQSTENKIEIYAIIKVPPAEYFNCKKIEFNILTRYRNMHSEGVINRGKSNLYFSKYNNNLSSFNDPDLFVKDNSFDLGLEPNWNPNSGDYTKSTSILNTLFALPQTNSVKTYDGINPGLTKPNFAQRSTQGNLNKLNIWVENKGCVVSNSEAFLSAYWTVARVFEPWGQHWHNHKQFGFFANDNFINVTDPNTGLNEEKPLGNHITLFDPWDYRSQDIKITIPPGVMPTLRDGGSQSYNGGFLTSIDWNPPSANWYLGASNIFRTLKAEPVFCYLAVIEEPNKINDGFLIKYYRESNTNITAFALYNNNVATVNSYLASPDGVYKRKLPNGNYNSNVGVILVDNPDLMDVINLSLIGENVPNNFPENANVYLTFDEVLWNRWSLANFAGTGFNFAGNNRVRVTNINAASFNGITLNNGERGMIGLEFEYFANNLPDSNYRVSFALGAYETFPANQLGSPTHFISDILSDPFVEIDEDNSQDSDPEPIIVEPTNLKTSENEDNFDLTVFPNPVSEKLFVTYKSRVETEDLLINIITLDGRVVFSRKEKSKKGTNVIKIDSDRLNSGTYLIEIKNFNGVQYKKFVKCD